MPRPEDMVPLDPNRCPVDPDVLMRIAKILITELMQSPKLCSLCEKHEAQGIISNVASKTAEERVHRVYFLAICFECDPLTVDPKLILEKSIHFKLRSVQV